MNIVDITYVTYCHKHAKLLHALIHGVPKQRHNAP